ncbi:MAG TPA: ATP-binding protein [Cyclobacteriaceae bacterium]|nr:ATP-binding protein [Cyclobacteriaceae bacterium]
MKVKGLSIRSRLIRLTSLVCAISLLIVFAALFIYEIVSYREGTIREMNILGNILAANSTAALAFNDADVAEEIISAVKSERLITTAVLFKADGSVLARFTGDSTAIEIPTAPGEPGFDIGDGSVEGFVPVTMGGKQLGTLYLRRSTEDTEQRLTTYAIIAGSVILVSFLLAYLLSSRLERAISDPLISLSQISAQISEQHDYSVRVTDTADGEVGQLKDAFNVMLSTIEVQNKEIQTYNQHLEFEIEERTRAYRREKEFAEAVVNSSLVLIAVFDTEMRFIGYNDKCQEEFGLTREQVLGKKFDEVMPKVKGTLTYESVVRALKGEFVHNPQYRSAVNGDFYESYMRPLKNDKGEIYAALMTAHNINGFIVSTTELQKRNADLEQFAYVASHDLQEPLRKVMLFSDRLTNQLTDKTEAVALYLAKIENAARRMSNLIRDVLSYSRLSQLEDSFELTDLNEVVAQVRTDLELIIEEKQAVINSDKLPVILGNALQLHQLFSNLINNALKFCETVPVVRITATRANNRDLAEAELPVAGHFARIEVIDNGVGFDQQYAERIFNLFQRLHQGKRYEGTGIGLALCKKIVTNHGGRISAQSVVGKGTTFTIFLPATPA